MTELVSEGETAHGVEAYTPPLMEGRIVTPSGEVHTGNIPTAEDIEVLIEQSKKEGFESGYAAAFEQGREDLARCLGIFDTISTQIQQPITVFDNEIFELFSALIVKLAEKVIARELSTTPEAIINTVRDAIQQLPLPSGLVSVHLHPEDLSLIRAALGGEFDEVEWNLLADTTLTRGGCRVDTACSSIDASVENRVSQIAAIMMDETNSSDD
ncbi:MAG: flagellar assembly protein FliH [Pseudomonadota bacterium]